MRSCIRSPCRATTLPHRALAMSVCRSTGPNAASARGPTLLDSACASTVSQPVCAPTVTAMMASAVLLCMPMEASAAARREPPPDESDVARCELKAFDKFAQTRAKFSMEASGGGMAEAVVDVRNCNFNGAVLDTKVLSGVLMSGAKCEGCSIKGTEAARVDLRDADLRGVSFEDTNLYEARFGGADLRGATFDNSILSSAQFGKGPNGDWANLEGAHFEGALLSSSDVERVCENPTVDTDVRKFELGCRASK